MKTLKIIFLILLLVTAMHAISKGQTYKVPIPNTDSVWLFQSLDDNKKVFTLVGDSLFIHKKIDEKIKEQLKELRYLRWKNKVYRYTFAVYDYAYFHGNRKGVEIW